MIRTGTRFSIHRQISAISLHHLVLLANDSLPVPPRRPSSFRHFYRVPTLLNIVTQSACITASQSRFRVQGLLRRFDFDGRYAALGWSGRHHLVDRDEVWRDFSRSSKLSFSVVLSILILRLRVGKTDNPSICLEKRAASSLILHRVHIPFVSIPLWFPF